jgi:acetoin utilization deacetylase AcuC-like enzyme
LIRPPGHHAHDHQYNGFCLVNNVIWGINHLKKIDKQIKIVVIDWDLHRGNGTQKLIRSMNNVFMIDIYQKGIFPFDPVVESDHILQIPLEKGKCDDDYIKIFDTLVIPHLEKSEPDWIIVSCGFDAHERDPMKGMKLTSKFYGYAATLLKKNKAPKTYFLEGGYDPVVIYESIDEMLKSYC